MNSPLIHALRQAACPLPARAFLRRDRGGALYVTNAPRVAPEVDWPGTFAARGFLCRSAEGLIALTPSPVWLERLERAHPGPVQGLPASLAHTLGLPTEAENLALFALGARALDGECRADAVRFDRLLRQRAAVCLRLNRAHPLPDRTSVV